MTSTLPLMPGDPGDAIWSPYSRSFVRSTSSSSTSMHHFRPRLVDRRDDAAGRGDAFGRVLDRERVGAGHARHAARVDDDAQEIDRLLQLGVAQIERPDDLLLVLAALGRRVRDDRDRARRRHAEERSRSSASPTPSASSKRGVAQLDRDRRLAERRVERDVDVRESGECGQDVTAAGVAEHER